RLKTKVKFCLCWRSSVAEQLPCKQWVGGSNPPASASQRFLDSEEFPRHMPAGSGRYPSGQRGQTVNLLVPTFGGSNPPLPTMADRERHMGGNSSAVERQPSKLGVAGSNPVSRSIEIGDRGAPTAKHGRSERWGCGGHVGAPMKNGGPFRGPHVDQAPVAQSAERVLCKDEVSGSIPGIGSIAPGRMAAVNGGR